MRLLALILLWNVVAGAFVTLGAPWFAEIAGTTEARSLTALPTGSGWLAIGVPTHFAGIWLPLLGVYALSRMRRHLPWQWLAALFYAPQIFAVASPVRVDLWIGLFAATSWRLPAGPTIAVNWVATALLATHAWLALSDSTFRMSLLGLSRDFWGSPPLSGAALARRFAGIATVSAFAFLPLVPADVFYPSRPATGLVETHWRLLLILPMTFAIAYAVAFVWSGGQREPRFSTKRGIAATLLTYVYVAMAADLTSRALSDGREPLFRLFLIAWIYLLPLMLLLPAVGAVTGAWLGRNVAASQGNRARAVTPAMWLMMAVPLLALLLSHALGAPQRAKIEAARAIAQRALAHFDNDEPDQLHAMFMAESMAMIDRDAFISALKERRDSLGALSNDEARRELRHHWYPAAGVIQFDYQRTGSKGQSNESIVIDVHGPDPALSAVFMTFEGQPPAHNIFVPRRHCGGEGELLHCGHFDDQPPRSLF